MAFIDALAVSEIVLIRLQPRVMEIRDAISSDYSASFNTAELRRHFLVEEIMRLDDMTMIYSHVDRIIFGGVMPVTESVPVPRSVGAVLSVDFLLQRRELGAVNIGGPGWVEADGTRFDLDNEEMVYVGQGCHELAFGSTEAANPAKFYYNCAPAHTAHPSRTVRVDEAIAEALGDAVSSNRRVIYKYLVPEVLPTCQLVMGMTKLLEGSTWNTMPCHTHDRRMEVYFYFRVPEDAAVIHLMGRPQETRHLVVQNEQAVISPSWSVHAGVGTRAYSFIWGMVGENQVFGDMDPVSTCDLR